MTNSRASLTLKRSLSLPLPFFGYFHSELAYRHTYNSRGSFLRTNKKLLDGGYGARSGLLAGWGGIGKSDSDGVPKRIEFRKKVWIALRTT